MTPWLRQQLLAIVGLGLFAATLGAEFGVLWAWQKQAARWESAAMPEPAPPQPAWQPSDISEAPEPDIETAPPAPLPPERRGPAEPVEPPAERPGGVRRWPRGPVRARLAIVIDDWGYSWPAAEAFLALDAPLTAAVLPNAPYARRQALLARRRGFEVLVHLPMEPQSPHADPGDGAITTDLPDEEIRHRVEQAIEAVPGAVGVSNHMGSRATADPRVMAQVLAVVGERGLFFLDSHTTPDSVAGRVAEAVGVPWAQNQVFLDSQPDPAAVRRQLELAVRRALATGYAIAIGHVRPATARVLAEALPELRRRGIELVPVSALIRPAPTLRRKPRPSPGLELSGAAPVRAASAEPQPAMP